MDELFPKPLPEICTDAFSDLLMGGLVITGACVGGGVTPVLPPVLLFEQLICIKSKATMVSSLNLIIVFVEIK